MQMYDEGGALLHWHLGTHDFLMGLVCPTDVIYITPVNDGIQ